MDFEGSNLVTVSCSNHCQYVAVALRNLFDSRRGTDFDLRWGEKAVRAHRTILELFLEPGIIGHNVGEQLDTPAVKQEVPDHDSESRKNILDCLVEFLYKGEVSVPEHQLEYLLRVARDLDFQMLVDAIVQSYSFKDYADGSAVELKTEEAWEDRTVETTKRSAESYSKNVDKPRCSLADKRNCRTVAPTYNFSHKVSAQQVEHFSEPLEPQSFEANTDPGCSNPNRFQLQADTIKVEPEHNSADECTVLEEWINVSATPTLPHGGIEQEYDVEPFSNHLLLSEMVDEVSSLDAEIDKSSMSLLNTDEQAKLFKCLHCEFETHKYKIHHDHLFQVHGLTLRGEPATTHNCPECDFSSVFLYKLKRHTQIRHSKEKPYACPHCSYVGKVKNTLDRHVIVVHGLGFSRYTCDLCGKRSASRSILDRHIRTHTNERPFKCLQCTFASNSKTSLKRHVLALH